MLRPSNHFTIFLISNVLFRYCQPAKGHLKCSEKLSTECLTKDEMLRWNNALSFEHGFLDYFCSNDASGITEFVNENGLECLLARNTSLELCYNEFTKYKIATIASPADIFGEQDLLWMFYGIPSADILCGYGIFGFLLIFAFKLTIFFFEFQPLRYIERLHCTIISSMQDIHRVHSTCKTNCRFDQLYRNENEMCYPRED